ncbi:hypothetical protein, partial [uncultured Acinetobacter sp.]|uniref:hypothetical protein n=1 Tax=uncultured Acinetobacter sp. TaxID=165433 RepID=UPI0025FCAC16
EDLNLEIKSKELKDFLEVVGKLQLEFSYRLQEYEKIKQTLNIGQVTAMIFCSLYAYEYLIPHKDYFEKLPYQFDIKEKNSPETVWKAFDKIIKTSRRNSKKLTEQSIGLALKFKMIPIMTGEGLTHGLVQQYKDFQKLVAIKIEILNYQRNVLESFSFDSCVSYELENGNLKYTNTTYEHDQWAEKNALLLNYWFQIGGKRLEQSDYIYRIANTGPNLDANIIALSKAFGIYEQLKQIYGITEININNINLDIFDLAKTITLSQAHYLKDHIENFEFFLYESSNRFNALTKLMIYGLSIDQNRMPLTFDWQKNKVKKMSSWIIDGNEYQKKQKMNQIINFWSCDLYDENNISSFSEKPFLKIDDIVFQFPWLTAFQNLNTSMINYARKLYKNHETLKEETDRIEVNLGDKFREAGFEVFTQYIPKHGNAGEIDLIAICGNHVLIAEVKSSYLRSSIKEIYEYRNFTLRKAAYQLNKKIDYLKSSFLSDYFEKPNEVKIYSWIIDTSLEFDHEYFDGHLKVSLDEVIIGLTNNQDFWDKFLNSDLSTENNKFDCLKFLENTESNTFWTKQLESQRVYMKRILNEFR